MSFFCHLLSATLGFGLGVYVHKNCHFESTQIKYIDNITGPLYLPTRWKTSEEKRIYY